MSHSYEKRSLQPRNDNSRSKPAARVVKYVLISAIYALIAGLFVFNILIFSHETSTNAETETPLRQLLAGGDSTTSFFSSSSSFSLWKNQQQQQKVREERNDDEGTFNGAPIFLRTTNKAPHSMSHCVGDNFQQDAWKFRSCHYSFLCFNTTSKDYVVFQSIEEQELSLAFANMTTKSGNPIIRSSSTLQTVPSFGGGSSGGEGGSGRGREGTMSRPQSVSIGGINFRWGRKGMKKLEWSPKIVNVDSTTTDTTFFYYELPQSAVMIPFHSLSGSNPGHLIWDDFMSIFSLLEMFDLVDRELMMMRYVLNDEPLWMSCDYIAKNKDKTDCEKMMRKFLPLMVGNDARYHMTTTLDFDFAPHTAGQSDLVCARSGVAGIGTLTDHGVSERGHGWELKDYEETHNHGRGAQIYAFRNFCLNNLGLPTSHAPASASQPRRIIFSQNSSDITIRNSMFEVQMNMTKQIAPSASVEGYVFKDLSMKEQITMMSETSIFVSFCGGGAAVATFMPKGSTVILFYTKGARGPGASHKQREYAAYLDWDLFQSMTHIRVHWVSNEVLKDSSGRANELLMQLIAHELSVMDSQAFESTY